MSKELPMGSEPPLTSEAVSVKVLPATARGVWVKTPGTLNFIDQQGTAHSLDAGYFIAGMQYPHSMKEITSGTTLVGQVLY